MVYDVLENKIEFLKGVGPRRAAILNKELQIFSFGDLLQYFPFRYVDKSRVHKVSEINSDQIYYQLIGRVSELKSYGEPRTTRISARFSDESGSIELVWFKGLKWVKPGFLQANNMCFLGSIAF